jgi:hypothetical protein
VRGAPVALPYEMYPLPELLEIVRASLFRAMLASEHDRQVEREPQAASVVHLHVAQ